MEPKEIIEKVNSDLLALQSQGQAQVDIGALQSYLGQLAQDATASTNYRNQLHQSSLAQYDATVKSNLEMFKSVIEAGKEALNAIQLINGGAVVALLGFIANSVSKASQHSIASTLSSAVLVFGLGVLCGALGFGARYFSQLLYSKELEWQGNVMNALSCGLAAAGYIAFGSGLYLAYAGFKSIGIAQ